jgi:hypothetical protein
VCLDKSDNFFNQSDVLLFRASNKNRAGALTKAIFFSANQFAPLTKAIFFSANRESFCFAPPAKAIVMMFSVHLVIPDWNHAACGHIPRARL